MSARELRSCSKLETSQSLWDHIVEAVEVDCLPYEFLRNNAQVPATLLFHFEISPSLYPGETALQDKSNV